MTEATYLQFQSLNGPVALMQAAEIETMLSDVLARWPHQRVASAPDAPPFVSIAPCSKGKKWTLTAQDAADTPRHWDTVNAVCDLVAEMAWERLRCERELLCLHAAAADFGGRLVVFPNARRAGKSTLAAALARLGMRLFTDDFVPIRVDAEAGVFLGVANGVAPRIRLPLPESFSSEFHDWVAGDPGPSNAQYKYLLDASLAPHGDALPLGAMVVLDRQDAPVPPTLSPIPREDALASMISQNFARAHHAGMILRSIDTLTRHLPVFRLTFHDAEAAAAYLAEHPDLQALPPAQIGEVGPLNQLAPLEKLRDAAPAFLPECSYVQAPGLTETEAGSDHFLADGTGLSIYRLNAGSAPIWRLLAEPITLAEVVETFMVAFPDVPPDQIARDCEQLMRGLAEARLITLEASDVAAQ